MNYMFTYRWLQNDRIDCAVLLPLTRGQTTSRVKLSLQFGGKTDMRLIKCNLVFKCFPSINRLPTGDRRWSSISAGLREISQPSQQASLQMCFNNVLYYDKYKKYILKEDNDESIRGIYMHHLFHEEYASRMSFNFG